MSQNESVVTKTPGLAVLGMLTVETHPHCLPLSRKHHNSLNIKTLPHYDVLKQVSIAPEIWDA
jgi:hypothetical protein